MLESKQINVEHVGLLLLHDAELHSDLNAISGNADNRSCCGLSTF